MQTEIMVSHPGRLLGARPAFARIDSHQNEVMYDTFDCSPIIPKTISNPADGSQVKNLHLLNLPREIRDQIYSHLYRPAQIRWELNKHDVHCVTITVPKAPITAILRTCTRLYEEYRESRLLRNLAAIVSTTRATNHETAALTDLQCHAVEGSLIMHAEPAAIEHVANLLATVRDLTILVNNKRSMTDDPTIWSELQTLESLLYPFHQMMSTIRIGIHQWQDPTPLQMSSRRETKAYTDSKCGTSTFMPTPKTTFMGKPLVQQAAGYRMQLVLLQLHPSDQKDLLERFHRHKTGAYVYSNDSPLRLAKDGLYWSEAEAVESFPMNCSWFNMQRSMSLN